MANTRSAEKRARQNIKRRQRNRGMKTRIKNLTKKVLSEKDREKAIALLKELYSVYDKAVKIGFIHRNTASRKKSKITKRVNQVLQAQGQ